MACLTRAPPIPRRSRAKYLAFLGRYRPEKRLDRAIRIAGQAGMKLKVAAKIDKADRPPITKK